MLIYFPLEPTWTPISSVSKRLSKNEAIYNQRKSNQLPSCYCQMRFFDQIICDMVKHELRIVSYESLVTSWKLKSTSWNSKVRVQIHELRVQLYELRVQIHELPVQIHVFKNHLINEDSSKQPQNILIS